MPAMSSTGSVLRWPSAEAVLEQARAWAEQQAAANPDIQAVGVFGSYGRGDAGVGSDLDLLLIDEDAEGPQHQRLRHWPLERLPLSCDALVLTSSELQELLAGDTRMARELHRDLRWLA